MDNKSYIEQVRTELNSKFIERSQDIEIILTSLVANTNCQFIGAPGTGKSALAQGVADLLTCDFFKVNLDENLDPDFVIGTISLKQMRDNDLILRNTQGKISDAHLVFLDEVNKSNSAMKNALLLPLNERKVDIGDGDPKPTNIRCVIGASNEYPGCSSLDDDTDHLLTDPNWDRWTLRYQSQYIKADSNFAKLLNQRLTIGRVDKSKAIPLEIIDDMRTACDTIDIDPIIPIILDLRTELKKEGITLSDRRWLSLCRIIQARAVMRGDSKANSSDLQILEHGLWRTPDEVHTVKDTLYETIGNEVGDAMKVLSYITQKVDIAGTVDRVPQNMSELCLLKEQCQKFSVDAGSKNWHDPEAVNVKKEIVAQLQILSSYIQECMRTNV